MTLYFIADYGYYNELFNNYDKAKKLLDKINSNITEKDILLLGGDNFYPHGLKVNNVLDWEKSYQKHFSKIKNVFGLLGNHDYEGIISLQFNNNRLFNMPNNYYKIEYSTYDIYMIDTILLDYTSNNDCYSVLKQLVKHNIDSYPTKKIMNELNELRDKMLKWLDEQMNISKQNNKNIIVCGHYNIFTYGMYFSENYYNKTFIYLLPLFVKYKVKIYLSGHDHGTQLHKINSSELLEILELQRVETGYISNKLNSLKEELKKSNYYIYNIVAGGCIDTYSEYIKNNKNKFKESILLFENYNENFYVSIKNNIINFHNTNNKEKFIFNLY